MSCTIPVPPTRSRPQGRKGNSSPTIPAPCVNPDGSVRLVYKARCYRADLRADTLYGDMVLGVAQPDGVHWEALPGKKAYSREVLWEGGKKQTMGSMERPFVLFQEGKSTHLFFAAADGSGGFAIFPLSPPSEFLRNQRKISVSRQSRDALAATEYPASCSLLSRSICAK